MPVIPCSLAYTLLLVVRITRTNKLLLCDDVLIHGLQHLEILPEPQPGKLPTKGPKGGKKSADSFHADDTTDLDAAQAVVRQLNLNDLQALQHPLEHLNTCGKLLEVCLLQFIGSEVLCRVFGREPSPFIFITTFTCAVYTLHRLLTLARLPITLDGRTHRNQGNMLLALFPLYSVIFYLIVLILPPGWLDVDMNQAGQGIMHGVSVCKNSLQSIRAVLQGTSDAMLTEKQLSTEASDAGTWEDTAVAPQLLQWVILGMASLISGLMVAAMVLPGQRMAMSLASTLHPPACLSAAGPMQNMSMPLRRGPATIALVLLTGAFPFVALLLWAVPISHGLLGLNDQQRALAQGTAVIIAGLLQLMTVKVFLQAHLSTALERWYLAKHLKSKSKTKSTTLIATSLINNTCAMLPRIAMLLVGSAVLLIALGCIICDNSALDRGLREVSEPGEVTLYTVAPFIVPPNLTSQCIARSVAFSALLAHSISNLAVLILRRNRVIRSTNV